MEFQGKMYKQILVNIPETAMELKFGFGDKIALTNRFTQPIMWLQGRMTGANLVGDNWEYCIKFDAPVVGYQWVKEQGLVLIEEISRHQEQWLKEEEKANA